MEPRRGIRNAIVPGRRQITVNTALHQAGIVQDMSYLDEKTISDESSIADNTHDMEEREWRKQGLSEKQIYLREQDRRQKKLKNAEDRLEREKFGAKTFKELLEKHEYSIIGDDEDKTIGSDQTKHDIHVFAVPLPKHLTEKSLMGSPVIGTRGSGKAGLSCSTPKSANDISMQSLKALDLSHVINTDQLDTNKVTIHNKNVLIPIVETIESSSVLKTHTFRNDKSSDFQGTFTKPKDDQSGELQGTFAKPKDDQSGELQGTFIKPKNDHSGELQGTFTKPKDDQSGELQGTFIKPKDDRSGELQRTFTKDEEKDNENQHSCGAPMNMKSTSDRETLILPDKDDDLNDHSSLQKTLTKLSEENSKNYHSSVQKVLINANEVDGRNSLLNNTYVVADSSNHLSQLNNRTRDQSESKENYAPEAYNVSTSLAITENTVEGGGKKVIKKTIGAQENKKRGTDLSSSLMNSMIEDVPSPGANYFKNPRKKLRPTAKTPPRAKAISRLSTESEKEKTIEMMSIAEEVTMESEADRNSPSFDDPLSENRLPASKTAEVDDSFKISNITPKSSRRGSSRPIRESMVELVRSVQIPLTPTASTCMNNVSSIITPKLNYQKPTFSSLSKNKIVPENSELLQASLRSRRALQDNVSFSKSRSQSSPVIDKEPRIAEGHEGEPNHPADENEHIMPTVPDVDMLMNIELDLSDLYIRRSVPQRNDSERDDVDNFEDDGISEPEGRDDNEPGPSNRRKPKRRMLSDSIAAGNTPEYERRSNRRLMNGTVADSTWHSAAEVTKRKTRGKKQEHMGLTLKKRVIIPPKDTSGGVRQSQRIRVKPVRFWLGEQIVYVNSPSGGKRITGVTDVTIRDRRYCQYKTADPRLATEREQRYKKALATRKRQQLERDHARGLRKNESQDDIHTDDEMDD